MTVYYEVVIVLSFLFLAPFVYTLIMSILKKDIPSIIFWTCGVLSLLFLLVSFTFSNLFLVFKAGSLPKIYSIRLLFYFISSITIGFLPLIYLIKIHNIQENRKQKSKSVY